MKIYVKSATSISNDYKNLLSTLKAMSDNYVSENPITLAKKMVETVGGTCTVERRNEGKKFRSYPSDSRMNYKTIKREMNSDHISIHYVIHGQVKTSEGSIIIPLTKNETGWLWSCFAEELVDSLIYANTGELNALKGKVEVLPPGADLINYLYIHP